MRKLLLSLLCRSLILKSLHAQADLLIIAVEINNLCGDDLANLQNIRRLINMIVRNLRNMKQCVYTRLKLYKCAEVCHTCHTTLYDIAYCILVSSGQPRILILELQAQSDLLTLDILDQDSRASRLL